MIEMTPLERQLYAALEVLLGVLNDIEHGDPPLPQRVKRAMAQAYEALNAADDSTESKED